MPQSDFALDVKPGSQPQTCIITPSGALVLEHIFKFQDAWRNAEGSALIFDLSSVPYLDSAAIGSLVNAHVSCSNHGRKMALTGVSDRIHQTLKVTHVDSLFRFYGDVDAAEKALTGQATSA